MKLFLMKIFVCFYIVVEEIHDIFLCILAIPLITFTFILVRKDERKEFLNDWFNILNK
jgi:hypothetical protein